MAFNRNAGGHAFDFDTGVCAKCGMTAEHFRDNKQPPCTGRKPTEKIFADAGQHATLHYSGKSVDGTLQEIIIERGRLSEQDRARAYIRMDDGTIYNASDIERLHYK